MKNAIVSILAVVTLGFSVGGCAMASGGNAGVMGQLYSSYKAPGAIGNGAVGAKSAKACASSILGVIATGDASVSAAQKEGGIAQVTHVDHDNFSILGIYATTCTIVEGN
jgi:hypothetical protein